MRRFAYSLDRWKVPVRPAGQTYDTTADLTITPEEAGIDTSGESLDAMLARLSGETGATSPTASTLTPAQQAANQRALYGAIGTAIGVAGTTIAAIIASGSAVDRQRVASAAQVEIATLMAQAREAEANGNAAEIALLREQLIEAQRLQQAVQPDHTVWWIAGGAVVLLAAIGGTVYVVTRKKKARRNPRHRHHRAAA